MTKSTLTKELIDEVRTLAAPQLREVRAYVYFLKARRTVDPSQLYFWTKQWLFQWGTNRMQFYVLPHHTNECIVLMRIYH